ncbi:peptidylprolyl isomerase [Xenorhabdus thuongxuanensis]|uniref:Peptidyl-prolyl cis-trans isomerase n=1 Tax=Xenorhabdus thuongxuanensis TaxID=1873484 RepID=A0A1Q5U2T8_9GAMM|nr:peptidylprolyl isomerase [Xenorhabdus thuongxuanensis]OKP06810.1 Dot/Icm type IV secretion system effector LirB [Xenorhabdus thuongxuanensis]
MNRRLFIGGCLGLCAGAAVLPTALSWLSIQGDIIEMELDSGTVTIQLFSDLAPNHVDRIKTLVQSKFYDGMPFSRVIDGFMAQTGDPVKSTRFDHITLPKLAAEFNHLPFERGTIGMARSRNPHSACHQFFITSTRANFLDNNYTAFGKVTRGMDLIEQLRRGDAEIGTVVNPDVIKRMRLVTTEVV